MTAAPARVATWCTHPRAMPRTSRDGSALTIGANGTRTCAGGWQLEYGVRPGATYEIAADASCVGVPEPAEQVCATVSWAPLSADGRRPTGRRWDSLLPAEIEPGRVRFARVLTAPPDATELTVRYTLRWTPTGTTAWSLPQVREASPGPAPRDVRIAVVTGTLPAARATRESAGECARFYGALCERAVGSGADLVLLPEPALQYGLAGRPHPLDVALPLDCPELVVFSDIARRGGAHLVVGLWERDGDAVFNSAVLIGPTGTVDGIYRKVHLAVGGEGENGILPGSKLPVWETALGRIGAMICADTAVQECSRLLAVQGADIVVMPIAGDNRADRRSIGPPIFHEDRWRAIMRTRAMDNHVTMVVARNEALGSCVIDPRGEIVAWNEGDVDLVTACVPVAPDDRAWNGGSLRDIQWLQRRPHLYHGLLGRGGNLRERPGDVGG